MSFFSFKRAAASMTFNIIIGAVVLLISIFIAAYFADKGLKMGNSVLNCEGRDGVLDEKCPHEFSFALPGYSVEEDGAFLKCCISMGEKNDEWDAYKEKNSAKIVTDEDKKITYYSSKWAVDNDGFTIAESNNVHARYKSANANSYKKVKFMGTALKQEPVIEQHVGDKYVLEFANGVETADFCVIKLEGTTIVKTLDGCNKRAMGIRDIELPARSEAYEFQFYVYKDEADYKANNGLLGSVTIFVFSVDDTIQRYGASAKFAINNNWEKETGSYIYAKYNGLEIIGKAGKGYPLIDSTFQVGADFQLDFTHGIGEGSKCFIEVRSLSGPHSYPTGLTYDLDNERFDCFSGKDMTMTEFIAPPGRYSITYAVYNNDGGPLQSVRVDIEVIEGIVERNSFDPAVNTPNARTVFAFKKEMGYIANSKTCIMTITPQNKIKNYLYAYSNCDVATNITSSSFPTETFLPFQDVLPICLGVSESGEANGYSEYQLESTECNDVYVKNNVLECTTPSCSSLSQSNCNSFQNRLDTHCVFEQECYYDDDSCKPCPYTRGCDYDNQGACELNDCSMGEVCIWETPWYWFDGCAEFKCPNYENQNECENNLMHVAGNCRWSGNACV